MSGFDTLEISTPARPFSRTIPFRESETPVYHGIVSNAEKLRTLSKYQTEFDFSVYGDLEKRYLSKPARGGILFKSPFKLVNHHSSCSLCHYAFEIDTYGRGCTHNCKYCYAKEMLTAHGYWNQPQPFPVDVTQIHKIFYTVFETNKRSKWRSILEKKVPLRIGSMSDSFMWLDRKFKVTKELLRILSFYRYPHIIFTRSDLIAIDDYLREMQPTLTAVQFSISGDNPKITQLLEPGAPSVSRRMKALSTLVDAGIWTGVRINPFFPIHPDGYFTDPQSVVKRFGSLDASPKLELFSLNLLDQIKETGTKSFLAGIVRLSPAAVKAMSVATGVDFKTFFKPEAHRGGFDLHYSDREIRHYYGWLSSEGLKRGLRFSTCYIGQPPNDYVQYQDLWANKSDCCDVRGNLKSFKASSQDIPWEERAKFALNKAGVAEAEKAEIKIEKDYGSSVSRAASMEARP